MNKNYYHNNNYYHYIINYYSYTYKNIILNSTAPLCRTVIQPMTVNMAVSLLVWSGAGQTRHIT